MTPSGPRWAVCQWPPICCHAFPSFDSGAVGDHFRVAVATKARETDLSYPAVGLSDYAEMMPVVTCQPAATIAWASRQVSAVPSCSAASELSLSVAGCTVSKCCIQVQDQLSSLSSAYS